MITVDDLRRLPSIEDFKRLAQALATLDAILSPDWDDRYYSFNSRWSDGEMMASMRNGSGDHWFALISHAGVALHGLAHEAPSFRPGEPRPGVFGALPRAFLDNFLHEPAFDTANSTFCIWRLRTDDQWQRGPVSEADGDDGSSELLSLLFGDPADYVAFANEYYERDVDAGAVAAVYRHCALTENLVHRLNPDVALASIREDLDEIGYP